MNLHRRIQLSSQTCHPSVLFFLVFCSVFVSAWNEIHSHHVGRRKMLETTTASVGTVLAYPSATHASVTNSRLQTVTDPNTYSALSYAPPNNNDKTPLILVLHGAGRNDLDILSDLANPQGEHAGLIPSLIADATAPPELLENFAVLAPYSYRKPSFYQDPRSQLLNFLQWAIQNRNTESLPLSFDPNHVILFGFSDGATVAVELLTTRRFAGAVICSYGYSGKALPAQALERLANIPIWIFHSADDVIFDAGNSDRLVQQLKQVSDESLIRYSRFDSDPENLPPRVRGHSMGITGSKMPQVYEWMLNNVPPIGK